MFFYYNIVSSCGSGGGECVYPCHLFFTVSFWRASTVIYFNCCTGSQHETGHSHRIGHQLNISEMYQFLTLSKT